ncbi:discoidin domain-containing protein [Stieleria varia]|uniref:Beta-L-arabinobiosidase n=1 Tax=Stieleria varia TaxID=2528005 RepID=A0A5C6AS18_9BACT|nr:discoidin domain-containing protein [Stieleria varia]TWU02207.1 Beta-L-arabinobiosidase precursor [Stieleria varia]
MMRIAFLTVVLLLTSPAYSQVLDKQQLLDNQSWWDNRDFDWYKQQIPFFECPDAEIQTTYYYRWDLLTKHLTYGSPNSGYSFTEFIDRPFWSGAYGAIACPAGHQLYETRWLRSPRIANDYTKYWFRTPGAQPRNYSTWLADSAWAVGRVHPNKELLIDLLPDLIENYEGWEKRQFVPNVGLFWQTGHDDGMEFNINSRQTQDILRGAPSYRPSFNAYMYADAQAISRIAKLAGKSDVAKQYSDKAAALKAKMIELMWDPKRQFFFPLLKNDEQRDGFTMKALTRTYESGQYAGDPHGRELIGYVPWQFDIVKGEHQYDVAWKKLMDRDGFYADFGPSFVERNDPLFKVTNHCCWWSGQSWPYATTQTLKALAKLLQNGGNTLNAADYVETLHIYAKSHRKNGKPYLAEALHPDTGSFEGYDGYNHSEHYLHSGYTDLVITGLIGLVPRDDDTLEIRPLAPPQWDYFALDDVPYRGHRVSIVWDKTGTRYDMGIGLHVMVDGTKVHEADTIGPIVIPRAVPGVRPASQKGLVPTNFAVNNDGTYYPRITTTYTAEGTFASKLIDGNFWYLKDPPNRWSCEGSPNASDSIEIDFGKPRTIHTIRALPLDDRELANSSIRAPKEIRLHYWKDNTWHAITVTKEVPAPEGHRPHSFHFEPLEFQKFKVTLTHADGFNSGLTELEAWGKAVLPLSRIPARAGNLAFNDGVSEFPKATCSHHDVYGGVPQSSIDGVTNFQPSPMNRWTSYGSPNPSDWLQIDFGKKVEFRRVEIAIYDDRGGVQAPQSYELQRWFGGKWTPISGVKYSPEKPVGGQWNTVTFAPTESEKLRIVFENNGGARSGVTEVTIWNDEQ